MSEPITTSQLRAWGRHTHRSPLYAHLVELTADTPSLMGVIGRIRNLPQPNVYFAAIHYLLLQGADHPLTGFYGSLVEDPLPFEDVDEPFRDFVSEYSDEIVDLANTRYTQTNECRRCVALLPGVMASTDRTFHLVEIGTSAGLNLALDMFRYSFDGLTWGPDSSVVLDGATPGEPPQLDEIEVLSRTGIDLNIIDRNDPSDRLWLDSLIWPEHHERRARLRAALELTAEVGMTLIEGDVLELLADVLSDLPANEPAVVMNSFVLNQLDQVGRDLVAEIIEQAGQARPIHRVSLEFIDKDDNWARLQVSAGASMVPLGSAHPHGEWVDLDYSSIDR